LPLRQYAAEKASEADPRDFLGQVKAIYDDVTQNRWRYVYDPLRVEMLATSGPVIYDNVLGFGVKPPAHGYGDCDCISTALGALMGAIGIPSRVVNISKPHSKKLFDHGCVQARIPKVGWVSLDAVGYPKHPMGWIAPHERYAIWDTEGNLRGFGGNYPGGIGQDFKAMSSATLGGIQEVQEMSLAGCGPGSFRDYGLENFGMAGVDNEEPEDWSTHGLLGFGAYVDQPYGLLDYSECGLVMEYDDADTVAYYGATPLVRTKM